jgi:uncharacterized protein
VTRAVAWRGLVEWLAEHAVLELSPGSVQASGVQLGVEPLPYCLDYRVEAGGAWATRSLELQATGAGWRRQLSLRRDRAGTWSFEAGGNGEQDTLGEPGGDPQAVSDALDCDLGFSPLTNLMPVRRHALHEEPGSHDFVMALVSVPDLRFAPAEQRYEHVRSGVVRFLSGDFVADLVLDRDGLVRIYPDLAERV